MKSTLIASLPSLCAVGALATGQFNAHYSLQADGTVRVAPAWLSFIPTVWSNDWVINLDPEYQLVAVGEPKREEQ